MSTPEPTDVLSSETLSGVTMSDLLRRIVDEVGSEMSPKLYEAIDNAIVRTASVRYAEGGPGKWSTIRAVKGADSLDAAWAEAEAALPGGWLIGGIRLEADGDPSVPDDWNAWAGEPSDHCQTCSCGRSVAGRGPTPAAALRALTARLRA